MEDSARLQFTVSTRDYMDTGAALLMPEAGIGIVGETPSVEPLVRSR